MIDALVHEEIRRVIERTLSSCTATRCQQSIRSGAASNALEISDQYVPTCNTKSESLRRRKDFAATQIQAHWRGFKCRQNFVVGTLVRKEMRYLMERTLSSCTETGCQQNMRSRSMSNTLEKSDKPMVIIDNIEIESPQERKDLAATRIQARWRGFKCRRQKSAIDALVHREIKHVVERSLRSFIVASSDQALSPRGFSSTSAASAQSAPIENVVWGSTEERMKVAATRIQSQWRGFQCRQKLSGDVVATISYTSSPPAHNVSTASTSAAQPEPNERIVRKLVQTQKDAAASRIQAHWRGFKCRQKLSCDALATGTGKASTTHDVSTVSATAAQPTPNENITKESIQKRGDAAASRIQAQWRGFKCRLELSVDSLATNSGETFPTHDVSNTSTTAARSAPNGNITKELIQTHEYAAATRIQAQWRGFKCRRQQKLSEDALGVDSVLRSSAASTTDKASATQSASSTSVTVAQPALNESSAKESIHDLEDIAAALIQAHWHGFKCRQKLSDNSFGAESVSKSTQSASSASTPAAQPNVLVHAEVNRGAESALKSNITSTADEISIPQSTSSASTIATTSVPNESSVRKSIHSHEDAAAARIQAHWRGFKCRHKFMIGVLVHEEIRCVIERTLSSCVVSGGQQIIRNDAASNVLEKSDQYIPTGNTERESPRRRTDFAAAQIQAHWRGFKCRQKLIIDSVAREEIHRVIERTLSSSTAPDCHETMQQSDRSRRDAAAIRIQSRWHRFKCRRKFIVNALAHAEVNRVFDGVLSSYATIGSAQIVRNIDATNYPDDLAHSVVIESTVRESSQKHEDHAAKSNQAQWRRFKSRQTLVIDALIHEEIRRVIENVLNAL